MSKYDDLSPKEAAVIQNRLADKIDLSPLQEEISTVGGVDISFNRGSNRMHAAIIVLDSTTLEVKSRSLISCETTFPYIPGLLAFREMPVLMKAWHRLEFKPDVLILDGHGIAHPRRMGIATHFGIEVKQPTMGCAKNILTGTHDGLGEQKGASATLVDGTDTVGLALRSRTKVNPVYISPGHHLSLEDAYQITMKVLTKYKLPRTTRLAHQWANKLRKGEADPGYHEL